MEIYYWAAPLLIVSSGFSFFLGAYLKRKGESIAIREELGDLVKQTAALTKTTKDIEAKISGDLWDKQKRWEMKRDVLFQAVKEISLLEAALSTFSAVASTSIDPERRAKPATDWDQAVDRFNTTLALTRLVASSDVVVALQEFAFQSKTAFLSIIRGETDAFARSITDRMQAERDAINEIRKELIVDPE